MHTGEDSTHLCFSSASMMLAHLCEKSDLKLTNGTMWGLVCVSRQAA